MVKKVKAVHFLILAFYLILLTSCGETRENKINKLDQLMDQQKYTGALSDLDALIISEPDNIDFLFKRAICHSFLRNYKKALIDYSKAIHLKPKLPLLYYNRGLCYYEMHIYKNAVEDFNRAYELKGGDFINIDFTNELTDEANEYDILKEIICYDRALTNLELGYLIKAKKDLNYCIEKGYLLEQSYYWRAIINKAFNESQKACADFEQAAINGNVDAKKEFDNDCNSETLLLNSKI